MSEAAGASLDGEGGAEALGGSGRDLGGPGCHSVDECRSASMGRLASVSCRSWQALMPCSARQHCGTQPVHTATRKAGHASSLQTAGARALAFCTQAAAQQQQVPPALRSAPASGASTDAAAGIPAAY